MTSLSWGGRAQENKTAEYLPFWHSMRWLGQQTGARSEIDCSL